MDLLEHINTSEVLREACDLGILRDEKGNSVGLDGEIVSDACSRIQITLIAEIKRLSEKNKQLEKAAGKAWDHKHEYEKKLVEKTLEYESLKTKCKHLQIIIAIFIVSYTIYLITWLFKE